VRAELAALRASSNATLAVLASFGSAASSSRRWCSIEGMGSVKSMS
jgi:hypothetical protein